MGRFPNNFYIGASTAAHQVEGNNVHSDYWVMEHLKHTNFNEPSLDAVDHYNRYEEDIKLLAQAGLNAYRFSIEWARIEPVKGQFDKKEIEHYRSVLKCCHENAVTPIVTMMHFTSPVWVIKNGGWESEETVKAFTNYCEYVVTELGDLMHYVVTINEANMGIQVAAIAERYKKQMMAQMKSKKEKKKEDNLEGTAQVGMNFNKMMKNMFWLHLEQKKAFGTANPQTFVSARTPEGDILVMKAHKAAKEAMKSVCPNLLVGLSLSLHDIQPVDGGKERASKEWNDEFLHYIPYIKNDDFFGLQNYSRSLIGPDGILPNPTDSELSQMGYEIYPAALEHVIRQVDKDFKDAGVNMPIMITENGLASWDDKKRIKFIDDATKGVANCIEDGINVLGYCHWSLLDNFEWQKGFSMHFGLIEVDRKTMKRTAKESLSFLGHI